MEKNDLRALHERNAAVPDALGGINKMKFAGDAFAKLPALAERLGVKPMEKDHPPTWAARTKDGISYDIFDLINGVLDYVDKKS